MADTSTTATMKLRPSFVAISALLVISGGPLRAQDTVRFEPKIAQPTFAVREPVLRIKPKTVLISRTNFGPYYTEKGGAFPGEVGPIYIEGATTNDILVVKIHKVRPNHDIAAAQIYSDFGGLATESRVRMLNDPIKPRRYIWRLDREKNTATTDLPDSRMKKIEIDLQPMLGRVAVAPAAPRHSAESGPATSAATWMHRRSGRAQRYICRSFTMARISISATGTRGRATEKSPAPGSRHQWTWCSSST